MKYELYLMHIYIIVYNKLFLNIYIPSSRLVHVSPAHSLLHINPVNLFVSKLLALDAVLGFSQNDIYGTKLPIVKLYPKACQLLYNNIIISPLMSTLYMIASLFTNITHQVCLWCLDLLLFLLIFQHLF